MVVCLSYNLRYLIGFVFLKWHLIYIVHCTHENNLFPSWICLPLFITLHIAVFRLSQASSSHLGNHQTPLAHTKHGHVRILATLKPSQPDRNHVKSTSCADPPTQQRAKWRSSRQVLPTSRPALGGWNWRHAGTSLCPNCQQKQWHGQNKSNEFTKPL